MGTFYLFKSEQAAKSAFFDTDVEECQRCGKWSASFADHSHGAIVSDCTGYARVCLKCDEELATKDDIQERGKYAYASGYPE